VSLGLLAVNNVANTPITAAARSFTRRALVGDVYGNNPSSTDAVGRGAPSPQATTNRSKIDLKIFPVDAMQRTK
jgi:hypothetical protein